MGGFALHLQHHGVDAVGGDGHGVLVRRLVGEDVIVLAGELSDDLLRTGRAHFLIRVEQHGEGAETVELLRLQQLDRMQDHRHAAFGIGHAGAIGALLIRAERSFGGGAFGEYGVVVDHQQEVCRAGAFQRADDVVAGRRRGRGGRDLGTQRFEALDQHFADPGQPLLLAGAGVHCHQCLQGFEIGRLLRLGLLEQLAGPQIGREDRKGEQAEREGSGDGCTSSVHGGPRSLLWLSRMRGPARAHRSANQVSLSRPYSRLLQSSTLRSCRRRSTSLRHDGTSGSSLSSCRAAWSRVRW